MREGGGSESDGPRESAEVDNDRVGISVLALCCAGVIMCFSAYVINQSTFLFTNSWAVVTRWLLGGGSVVGPSRRLTPSVGIRSGLEMNVACLDRRNRSDLCDAMISLNHLVLAALQGPLAAPASRSRPAIKGDRSIDRLMAEDFEILRHSSSFFLHLSIRY